jgi:hypothetical protein
LSENKFIDRRREMDTSNIRKGLRVPKGAVIIVVNWIQRE